MKQPSVASVVALIAILLSGDEIVAQNAPSTSMPSTGAAKASDEDAVICLDVPRESAFWDGDLQFRSMRRNGGDVLLRFRSRHASTALNADAVDAPEHRTVATYRYDVEQHALTPIDENAWDDAAGEVFRLTRGRHAETFDPPGAIRRRTVIATPSWDSTVNAVVVAQEVREGGPVLQVLQCTPPYECQLFSVPDSKPIGRTVRLPINEDLGTMYLLWSVDDEVILVRDWFARKLFIISADKLRPRK